MASRAEELTMPVQRIDPFAPAAALTRLRVPVADFRDITHVSFGQRTCA